MLYVLLSGAGDVLGVSSTPLSPNDGIIKKVLKNNLTKNELEKIKVSPLSDLRFIPAIGSLDYGYLFSYVPDILNYPVFSSDNIIGGDQVLKGEGRNYYLLLRSGACGSNDGNLVAIGVSCLPFEEIHTVRLTPSDITTSGFAVVVYKKRFKQEARPFFGLLGGFGSIPKDTSYPLFQNRDSNKVFMYAPGHYCAKGSKPYSLITPPNLQINPSFDNLALNTPHIPNDCDNEFEGDILPDVQIISDDEPWYYHFLEKSNTSAVASASSLIKPSIIISNILVGTRILSITG